MAQALFQPLDVAFPILSLAGVYLLEGGFQEGFGFLVFFFGGCFLEFFLEGSKGPPR